MSPSSSRNINSTHDGHFRHKRPATPTSQHTRTYGFADAHLIQQRGTLKGKNHIRGLDPDIEFVLTLCIDSIQILVS
jgi:hypothetical protein